MKNFKPLFFFFIGILNFQLKAQFPYFSQLETNTSLPSSPQAVDQSKIHLILLSEGYNSDEEQLFMGEELASSQNILIKGDAEEFFWDLANKRTPFKEYVNYFEVYKIFEPSTFSGVHHPQTLSEGYPECETSVNDLETSFPKFKSTLDKYGIHRGLGAYIPPTSSLETNGYDEIINFLKPHFGSFIDSDGKEKLPENVFVVVICNDNNYAGAANIPRRICHVAGGIDRNLIYSPIIPSVASVANNRDGFGAVL